MSRPPLPGLAASLALHVVLVTAVLAVLPRSERLPPLFVDLTVAEPRAERASPPGARAHAEVGGAAHRRESGRRVTALPTPERPRELPAPAPSLSTPPITPEAPAPLLPTAEPPAPMPLPPPPPVGAHLSPPATSSGDATPSAESSRPEPEPPAPAPREPEVPSAGEAPSDGGGTLSEPSSLETHDGALAEITEPEDASGGGTAASPDLGSSRPLPGGGGDSGGAGEGQQLARRSPGSEGGEARYTEYLSRLRQRLHQTLRYPPAARRRGLTGAVTLELTILPSGLISEVSVVKTSSHAVLDEAAVESVRALRAQPFPAGVPPRTLRVRLPVVFQLE